MAALAVAEVQTGCPFPPQPKGAAEPRVPPWAAASERLQPRRDLRQCPPTAAVVAVTRWRQGAGIAVVLSVFQFVVISLVKAVLVFSSSPLVSLPQSFSSLWEGRWVQVLGFQQRVILRG